MFNIIDFKVCLFIKSLMFYLACLMIFVIILKITFCVINFKFTYSLFKKIYIIFYPNNKKLASLYYIFLYFDE